MRLARRPSSNPNNQESFLEKDLVEYSFNGSIYFGKKMQEVGTAKATANSAASFGSLAKPIAWRSKGCAATLAIPRTKVSLDQVWLFIPSILVLSRTPEPHYSSIIYSKTQDSVEGGFGKAWNKTLQGHHALQYLNKTIVSGTLFITRCILLPHLKFTRS